MGAVRNVAVVLTIVAWFGSLVALVVLAVLLVRARQAQANQPPARPRVRTIDRVRAAARWAGWRAGTDTADRMPGVSREQTAYRPGPRAPQGQRGSRLPDEPTRRVPRVMDQPTGRMPRYADQPTSRVPRFADQPTSRVPRFADQPTSRVPQPGPRYPRPGESYPRPGERYPRPDASHPSRRPSEWAPDEDRRQQTQQNASSMRRRPDWQGSPPSRWDERDQPPPRPPQDRRGPRDPFDPYER
jgi:hypothetical protein